MTEPETRIRSWTKMPEARTPPKQPKRSCYRVPGAMLAVLIGSSLLCIAPVIASDSTRGDLSGRYVEARTADVYTGPCFGNSEVNLVGKEAVLGWQIEAGSWNGVRLDDLGVAAVVRSDSTLGDPHTEITGARALLVVDERANAQQEAALVAVAHELSGALLEEVVEVVRAPVSVTLGHHGSGELLAGDLAVVKARSLHDGDHLCGNETVFYPPLVEALDGHGESALHAHPGVAVEHRFSGPHLGATWSSPDKRSTFAGRFSLGS